RRPRPFVRTLLVRLGRLHAPRIPGGKGREGEVRFGYIPRQGADYDKRRKIQRLERSGLHAVRRRRQSRERRAEIRRKGISVQWVRRPVFKTRAGGKGEERIYQLVARIRIMPGSMCAI